MRAQGDIDGALCLHKYEAWLKNHGSRALTHLLNAFKTWLYIYSEDMRIERWFACANWAFIMK